MEFSAGDSDLSYSQINQQYYKRVLCTIIIGIIELNKKQALQGYKTFDMPKVAFFQHLNINFFYNVLRSDSSNDTLQSGLDVPMKIKDDSPPNTYLYHASSDLTVRETSDETIDIKKISINKQKKRPAPAPPKSSHMEMANIEDIKCGSKSYNKCF